MLPVKTKRVFSRGALALELAPCVDVAGEDCFRIFGVDDFYGEEAVETVITQELDLALKVD